MSKDKQEEFLACYEPIHDRFERFCRARAYGDVEYKDLMNDTLLVAYQKFDSIKTKDSFLSFLFGISVRLLANNKRKKKEATLPPTKSVNNMNDVNANTSLDAEIHFLYEALSQINEAQRESLILFEISGFSIKEVAVIQNTTESAVKQRLKRGREALVEIMTFESPLKTGTAS